MAKPFYVYNAGTLKEIIRDEAKRTVEQKIVPKIKKNISDEAKKIKSKKTRFRTDTSDFALNTRGKRTRLGALKNITSETVFGEGLQSLQSKSDGGQYGFITFIQDETTPQLSVYRTPLTNDDPTLFSQWINNGEWMDLYKYISDGYPTKEQGRPKRTARPYFDKAYEKSQAALSEYQDLIANDLCSRLSVTRLP